MKIACIGTCCGKGSRKVVSPDRSAALKNAEAHDQHKKYIDKGLARRQGIRIVKTVPDKIQYIDRKACEHK